MRMRNQTFHMVRINGVFHPHMFFCPVCFLEGNGVFSCAGHFPCKAISKIVQLPTEKG